MNLYSLSLCNLIRKQAANTRPEPGANLIVTLPGLAAADARDFLHRLADFAQEEGWRLVFKCADEYRRNALWDDATIADFAAKDHFADGLTLYRNALASDAPATLTVLVGTDLVTDSGSLKDFYSCGEETVWVEEMGQSFSGWLEVVFNEHGLALEDANADYLGGILEELRERAGLAAISNLLGGGLAGDSAEELAVDLLAHLGAFRLPNLAGYTHALARKRKFRRYTSAAYSFLSYDDFIDFTKRKKAREAVGKFRDSLEEDGGSIPEEKFAPHFPDQEAFLDGLLAYINANDRDALAKIARCDFVYILDEILKFKPKSSTSKDTLAKLAGSPLEAVLLAIWQTFERLPDVVEIERIELVGVKYRHDVSSANPETCMERAHDELVWLFGGLDRICGEHIQLNIDAAEPGRLVPVDSRLLHDDLACESAKTAEPSFEFKVVLHLVDADRPVVQRYALKLPDIHPWRLACVLFRRAEAAFNEMGTFSRPFSLPVFHLAYYAEFMMARESEEQCRVLRHCLNADAEGFAENVITDNWAKAPEAAAMKSGCTALMASYRSFLRQVNQEGLHAALNLSGETPDLFRLYNETVEAFIANDPQAKDCRQIAAALMRSFLIIASRKGEDADVWTVTPYEGSGVVTTLHPAMLEMLQAQLVFLCASFSKAVSEEWRKRATGGKKAFARKRWDYYRDLSEMKMPLVGLPINKDGRFEVCVNGEGLLHRIGEMQPDQALASTRFLIRYDQTEEEDVAEAEMFRESSESRHLFRILRDYNTMHPAADDGISLAIYRNNDVQPVLAAINNYVKYLHQTLAWQTRPERYRVRVVFFSESTDMRLVTNWLTQWQNYLDDKEEDETSEYSHCRFSVAHRTVKTGDDYAQFAKTIKADVDADIFVFYNFMKPGGEGCRFLPTEEFDSTRDSIKFPVLEKAQCSSQAPDQKLRRSQVVSNRQLKIATNHAEIAARISVANAQQGQHHIVLAVGDYAPWRGVIDNAHEAAEWVVCIDPCIDVALLGGSDSAVKRELIGYGSGVGLHGESNYTISTQQFFMDDIRRILLDSIRRVNSTYGDKEHDETIRDCLLAEAKGLGGLSIIRALGPDEYIRDFMSYCLMRRILNVREEEWLCDKLFSIDAYSHWFEQSGADDVKHPDLLWLRTSLTEGGRLRIDAKVIECKMAQTNQEHIEKAKVQITNGLRVLSELFAPDPNGRRGMERPDQRYWYLQLHRLVAGCAHVSSNEEAAFLAAMERLTTGDFELTWNAAVFAFWTDKPDAELRDIERFDVEIAGGIVNAPIFTAGYRFVYGVSRSLKGEIRIDWGGDVPVMLQPAVSDEELPMRNPEPDGTGNSGGESDAPQLPPALGPDEPPTQPSVMPSEPFAPPEPPQPLHGGSAKPTDLPQHKRILLGRTIPGNRDVYWEFGHPQLNNRHFLIFGNSGMGKTYAIQAILCELARLGQNSLIVDYTNGFLPNQLQVKTNEVLTPYQFIVKNNKLPLSPFSKQKMDIGGGVIIENSDSDVAKRVSAIFDSVYNLGDQQISVLIEAIRDCVQLYGDAATFDKVLDIIQGFAGDSIHPKSSVMSLASRLKPFIQEDAFTSQGAIGWEELFSDKLKRCSVFQMAGVDKTTSRILTEFVLWDLYAFACSIGNEDKPKVLVLDEVQNLDQKLESPLGKILTEGRKFGLCVMAATQTLSNLKSDEQARLFQAGQKLFFRPADPEVEQYTKLVMQACSGGYGTSRDDWKKKLTSLQKGECLAIGPSFDDRTATLKNMVQKIKITALGERGF